MWRKQSIQQLVEFMENYQQVRYNGIGEGFELYMFTLKRYDV